MPTKKKAPAKKKAAVKSLVKAALARFDSYAGPDETPAPPPPKPSPEPKKAKCKGKCSTCATCKDDDNPASGFETNTDLTGATQLTDPNDKGIKFDIYRTADGCLVTRLRGPMPDCAKTCGIVCMLYATNTLLSEQLNKAAAILSKIK